MPGRFAFRGAHDAGESRLHSGRVRAGGGAARLDDRGRVGDLRAHPGRLERTRASVFRFGNIENDTVSVELRGRVAVHRTRAIVFEFGYSPFPCCFRGMVATHTRLDVVFHFVQSGTDTVPVRFANTLVTSNKRR